MNKFCYIACIIYGCNIEDLMGNSRKLPYVMARYLVFALAIDRGYKQRAITDFLKRGRCMTYHIARTVEDMRKHDKDFIITLHKANQILLNI